MPLLYLVQHGKAHPKEIDPKRPLTNEGKAETEKVAKQLADSNIVSVEKILHSGKERALETAKIFASFLNPSGGVHASENLAPLDDPSIWIKKLESIEKNTLIVGHLPYMSKLSSLLLAGKEREIIKFKNSGIVCLEKIEKQKWVLCWILTPELI